MSPAYVPARGMIDGGMARGVGTAEARARTITVYANVRRVVRELGLPGRHTIGVLLVERAGPVLARETGAFDEAQDGAARTRAAGGLSRRGMPGPPCQAVQLQLESQSARLRFS